VARIASISVVRQFESLFDSGPVSGLTDRQLLERFTAGPGPAAEAAFTALVGRHGPMVSGLCRQLLVDEHHAEDAFQAVFLVLARKAPVIRDPDLLGNWLYGVTLRTARNARLRLARQRKNEVVDPMRYAEFRSGAAAVVEPSDARTLSREQAEALHEEIDRLPGSFRLPLVCCYFEGLTLEEASRRLQSPVGTVGSRLARAREKLRRGLARRGLVPSVALAVALSPRSVRAAVPYQLSDATTRAAIEFAAQSATGASVSPFAKVLASEVLRAMLIHKLRFVCTIALFITALATGAALLSQSVPARDRLPDPSVTRQVPLAVRPAEANPSPAPGRMFVVGRVLSPEGNPVKGTAVELLGRARVVVTRGTWSGSEVLLGRGETDSDGRFRIDALRTSSVRYFFAHALVKAQVLAWAEINLDAQQPAVEIRLHPEQVIRGKLVDVNGQPAAGAQLRSAHFGRVENVGQGVDIVIEGTRPEGLKAWPELVKTDDQGRFVFKGLGRGLYVNLAVDDARYAQQLLRIAADDRDGPSGVTLTLQPAKTIEGHVVTEDTGLPLPGTVITVDVSRVTADAEGRFRANAPVGDRFGVHAYPPADQPYLVAAIPVEWTKGLVKKQLDIKLTRGVVISGKVTEQGSARPLSGSSILFVPVNGPLGVESKWDAIVPSADDGSFRIVVPAGKGHLLVFGPTGDFVHEVIGRRALMEGRPGGERWYAHKIIPYEVKALDPPRSIPAELRPGKTIRARVVGPDGLPVSDAMIITRLHIEPINPFWRGEWSRDHRVRDGFVELHGLDPDSSVLVYFLDAEHELGAAVELAGKQSGNEMTIRLEPAGRANGRFVGRSGKPIAGFHPTLDLIATPGPPAFRRNQNDPPEVADDSILLAAIDHKHYGRANRPTTDADGRITLPGLIPGALYRLSVQGANGRTIRKNFAVKSGESLDLGEFAIAATGRP
jgi:RNA polymerase sigma factor (sigma-70 family)